MFKRFAACLLALSLLSGGVLASAADEKDISQTENQREMIVISADDVEARVDAEMVSVPVKITNNKGVGILQVFLHYDSESFELSSVDLGDVFVSEDIEEGDLTASPYVILAVPYDNVAKDGVIVTLNFKVRDNIKAGKYIISLKTEVVTGIDENILTHELVDGSILVFGDEMNDVDELEVFIPSTLTENAPTVDEPILDKPGTDEPKEEEALIVPKFADTSGHWAVKYINDSVDLGLFRGDENGNFNPEQKITRAQFITVLWRMAGSPDMEATHSFDDVDGQSEEFQKAIAWGHGKGYVSGISETKFDPNGMLTREAGMKMLHYYSGGKVGQEAMFYKIYDGMIKDVAEIADWAKKSVYWGIYYEMISGTDNLTISPKSAMTRAQMAKIMVTYHNNVAS